MSREIERKFLIDKKIWDEFPKPEPEQIIQAYISSEKSSIVRVRIKGQSAFLTIKGETKGISRLEFEYAIPIDDARTMLENLCSKIIEKNRYTLSYQGHTWEVDIFFGKNQGLLIAEIELSDEEEKFQKPPWVTEEVSHDTRYFNSALIEHPFTQW